MQQEILEKHLQQMPLVAILRGIQPQEVDSIGEGLVDAGFCILEVPLNSPDPFTSIQRLSERVGGRALVGAGTVLSRDEVDQLLLAGGKLMVTPNTNPDLISYARDKGLITLAGFVTPSEAFCAIEAGATGLKLFPARQYGPGYIRDLRAVLPKSCPLLPVGGVTAASFQSYVDAGVQGFGLGSDIYQPGWSFETVVDKANSLVNAAEMAFGSLVHRYR